MNDSHGVASQLSCVGLFIQLLAWKAVLSLSVTHINARTQTHACRCEMNLNHVKALGNEEEPCFCFHKQLLCFRSTARLGGLDGWGVRASLCMFSGFPLLCWCSRFTLRSVDPRDRVWMCLSLCSGGVELNYTSPGVWAAKCVCRGTSEAAFASDLQWNHHRALNIIRQKYVLVVSHAATKDSNPTCNACKCIHSHARSQMFELLRL